MQADIINLYSCFFFPTHFLVCGGGLAFKVLLLSANGLRLGQHVSHIFSVSGTGKSQREKIRKTEKAKLCIQLHVAANYISCLNY